MTAIMPEQEEPQAEAVEPRFLNKKGVRRARWALQVVTCIILLPWSLPLIWKRIKENREADQHIKSGGS